MEISPNPHLINEAVVPLHPVFPNPYTLLAQIPPGNAYYPVQKLKDAFFCIPIYLESQPVFDFEDHTRKAGQVMDCSLPEIQRQRQVLGSNSRLGSVAISRNYSAKYADDQVCQFMSTESLLNSLADRGYKISKENALFCQSRVTYLGLVLEKEMRALADRIHMILMFPLPKTLKQLRAFLVDQTL
jgi:hypothetical protein